MKLSMLIRQHWAALRALLLFTVVLGIAYPLLIWLIAQVPILSDKADGSIVEVNGEPVGSSLIGQLYTDADGNPLPQYFQGRPSAATTRWPPVPAIWGPRASSISPTSRACSRWCARAAPPSANSTAPTGPDRSAPEAASARCCR